MKGTAAGCLDPTFNGGTATFSLRPEGPPVSTEAIAGGPDAAGDLLRLGPGLGPDDIAGRPARLDITDPTTRDIQGYWDRAHGHRRVDRRPLIVDQRPRPVAGSTPGVRVVDQTWLPSVRVFSFTSLSAERTPEA